MFKKEKNIYSFILILTIYISLLCLNHKPFEVFADDTTTTVTQDNSSTSITQDDNSIGINQDDNSNATNQDDNTTTNTKNNTNLDIGLNLTMKLSISLYKGDKVPLKIKNIKSADHIKVSSSNRKVATISKSGLIKAKKCGTAKLSMVITNGKNKKTLILKTKVTKCSYRKKKALIFYKKEKSNISVSTSTSGAITKISSSNPKVIKYKNNKLYAKKAGNTRITATTSVNKKSLSLTLAVKVTKKPKLKVTNEMVDKWFKGSVMAGHSVGVGFKSYCASQYDGFLGNARHISVGCYGVYNDRAPVSASSLHPTVNGKKARLKDLITMLKTKKVFINYGLNDIGVYGPDRFIIDYEYLIKELIRQNKKTTVYIVSPTPMYVDKGSLSNANMRKINKALKKYAKKTKRVEFIDVYTPLLDKTGKLKASYCSDSYCHITYAGYKVYADTLKKYAKKIIPREIDKKDRKYTKKESKKTR